MGVTLKPGVVLDTEAPAVRHMIVRFAMYPEMLTVTAGRDGQHMAGSKHYIGEAVDLRAWGAEGEALRVRARALEAALNADPSPPVPFRVLVEEDLDGDGVNTTHLHAQVRMGYTWPKGGRT